MTAVPKPLKFLMPHYDDLAKTYEDWPIGNEKVKTIFQDTLIASLMLALELFGGRLICSRHDPR